MFGSIHTHFESRYDTANDMKKMCENFIKKGAKKVAVTEHGVFSSYEDLRDIVKKIKGKAKENGEDIDFEIIPGIEGYFGDNHAHLILIAKDYEGYLSLCKIISQANENIDKKGNPIITIENLQKNVKKGHLIATSACIAGPFGRLFALDKLNLEQKIQAAEAKLENTNYEQTIQFIEQYEEQLALSKSLKITKKMEQEAGKLARKGDLSLADLLADQAIQKEKIDEWLQENSKEYQRLSEIELKAMKAAKLHIVFANLQENKEKLAHIMEDIKSGKVAEEAHLLYSQFKEIFGDDFYFELQNHGLEQEKEIYNEIIRFAYTEEEHPNFIASNDIHIGVSKEDPDYEAALRRRNVIQYTRFNTYHEESLDDKEYTIKDDEELRESLLEIMEPVQTGIMEISKESIVDQAIGNIQNVLSQCHVEFIKENHYPKFCEDENEAFRQLVYKGIKERFPNGFPNEEYQKRLEYELDVIIRMGYAGYHLIVADYLQYGRLLGYLKTPEEVANAPLNIEALEAYIQEKGYEKVGYNIGPGRGSAAGSLCCYLAGITDIDPLPYHLLFERFLNVERVSMPDIDSDFRTDIRERVVDYCKARYGEKCICQIMTKAYGALKGNLRLSARYLGTKQFTEGLQSGEINIEDYLIKEEVTDSEIKENVNTEIDDTGEEPNIDSLLEETPIFQGKHYSATQQNAALKLYLKPWYDKADKLSKQIDETGDVSPDGKEEDSIVTLAKELEGVFTNYGQHAAGTIISGDDLTDIIPLMYNSKKKNMETQCTMAQAEAKGLLKMDFLGLENLDMLTEMMRNPSSFYEVDNRLQDYTERQNIFNDPAIYEQIYSTALTQGVFQFESDGMKDMLKRFHPESLEDIILLVAAYRPGPLQYLDEIIAQKQYNDQLAGKPWMKDAPKVEKPTHSINMDCKPLNDILQPTYGCIIYQEQVMQIFQELAGYSLGGADLVRRAMSKKHMDELEAEREYFIHGGTKPDGTKIEGYINRFLDKKYLEPMDSLPEEQKQVLLKEKEVQIAKRTQEASTLFDQMIDFAAYAFNKSHATCYAIVSIFTAYMKLYHTADFFRVSLDHTAELKEIPPFINELPSFGLKLLPPNMEKSENNFTVEGENNKPTGIRFGLQKIKGLSAQNNLFRTNVLLTFIRENPDISLKVIEKYIQLGMFEEIYPSDVSIKRVHGNRHEQLRWLERANKLILEERKQNQKLDELVKGKTEAEKEYFTCPDIEKRTESNKTIHRFETSIANWTLKLEATQKALSEMENIDHNIKIPEETDLEHLENRTWESEMLSIPFDIANSMKKLQDIAQFTKKHCFDLLRNSDSAVQDAKVFAIVLNCSKKKKSKSGKSSYYDVTLMDANYEIINRRFNEPPQCLDGIFKVKTDQYKYYICDLNEKQPIPTKQEITEMVFDKITLKNGEDAARKWATKEGKAIGFRKIGGKTRLIFTATETTNTQNQEMQESSYEHDQF